MAVFDDLNPVGKRIEDPEDRRAEQIQRKGDGFDVRKRSSGVKISTYKSSTRLINILVGVGSAVIILGLAIFGVIIFVSG